MHKIEMRQLHAPPLLLYACHHFLHDGQGWSCIVWCFLICLRLEHFSTLSTIVCMEAILLHSVRGTISLSACLEITSNRAGSSTRQWVVLLTYALFSLMTSQVFRTILSAILLWVMITYLSFSIYMHLSDSIRSDKLSSNERCLVRNTAFQQGA